MLWKTSAIRRRPRTALASKEPPHGDELPERELQPELVDLVDGDEEHLVIGERGVVVLEPTLQGGDLLDLDVVPVRRRLAAHDATLPRGVARLKRGRESSRRAY
jgi:hypothetical protein